LKTSILIEFFLLHDVITTEQHGHGLRAVLALHLVYFFHFIGGQTQTSTLPDCQQDLNHKTYDVYSPKAI